MDSDTLWEVWSAAKLKNESSQRVSSPKSYEIGIPSATLGEVVTQQDPLSTLFLSKVYATDKQVSR